MPGHLACSWEHHELLHAPCREPWHWDAQGLINPCLPFFPWQILVRLNFRCLKFSATLLPPIPWSSDWIIVLLKAEAMFFPTGFSCACDCTNSLLYTLGSSAPSVSTHTLVALRSYDCRSQEVSVPIRDNQNHCYKCKELGFWLWACSRETSPFALGCVWDAAAAPRALSSQLWCWHRLTAAHGR